VFEETARDEDRVFVYVLDFRQDATPPYIVLQVAAAQCAMRTAQHTSRESKQQNAKHTAQAATRELISV
jgi:hypothetical protein